LKLNPASGLKLFKFHAMNEHIRAGSAIYFAQAVVVDAGYLGNPWRRWKGYFLLHTGVFGLSNEYS
jgi:hypothetical protein